MFFLAPLIIGGESASTPVGAWESISCGMPSLCMILG